MHSVPPAPPAQPEVWRRDSAEKAKTPLGRTFKIWLDTLVFKVTTCVALAIALFGVSLCVITDLPDDPYTSIMDGVMVAVMVFFTVEQVMRCFAEPRTYPFSFFFFMDGLGTVSMIFDISFLLGSAGEEMRSDSMVNAAFMRSARAAKVGARAVRLSKLVKCLSIFYGRRVAEAETGPGREAKTLNAKLMLVLSTKVAVLTLVLVLFVPVFSLWRYPGADLSMSLWSRRLEADYAHAYEMATVMDLQSTDFFRESCQELVDFYGQVSYFPYDVVGYPELLTVDGRNLTIPGASLIDEEPPRRRENVLIWYADCRLQRPACRDGNRPAIYMSMRGPNRADQCTDIAVIVFIIICMAAESLDLSHTLNIMVVKPVEKMLGTVHMMASVLSEVTSLVGEEDPLEEKIDWDRSAITEAELLERVFKRLAKLTEVFLEESIVAKMEMEGMDNESKGVIVELMQLEGHQTGRKSVYREVLPLPEIVVTDLSINPTTIDSWDLDILSMEVSERQKVLLYVFFDSSVGSRTGRTWVDLETFRRFDEVVRVGYHDNPYHNYAHACDVVASCSRLLQQVQWGQWLSSVDAYALLVSAVCHDIGHPGKTNPFLVETMDSLALRYNDKSPLENMHCAKLFEICRDSKTNVFGKFDRDAYKQARTACILAILNTDNALHFDMVKDIKKVYEVSASLCDEQARSPEAFVEQYVEDVLRKNTVLWIKLILHLADIANPLKSFGVYKLWASRVVEEFFAQGDEEKRLGIPVGMLNDREKVSRPGAEHGFITFLVAPLVISSVNVFPVLIPQATQMAGNVEVWRNVWVQQAEPSQEDIKKRDTDVQKIKEQVEQLRLKGSAPPTNAKLPSSPSSLRP